MFTSRFPFLWSGKLKKAEANGKAEKWRLLWLIFCFDTPVIVLNRSLSVSDSCHRRSPPTMLIIVCCVPLSNWKHENYIVAVDSKSDLVFVFCEIVHPKQQRAGNRTQSIFNLTSSICKKESKVVHITVCLFSFFFFFGIRYHCVDSLSQVVKLWTVKMTLPLRCVEIIGCEGLFDIPVTVCRLTSSWMAKLQ